MDENQINRLATTINGTIYMIWEIFYPYLKSLKFIDIKKATFEIGDFIFIGF